MYTVLRGLPSQLEHKYHEDKKFVLLVAGTPEARTKPDTHLYYCLYHSAVVSYSLVPLTDFLLV